MNCNTTHYRANSSSVPGDPTYLSIDSGLSWKQAGLPVRRWGGVAGSSDGRRLIAAAWEGDVYISCDSGQSWNREDAPVGPWLPVASSADGIHVFLGIWDTSSGGIYQAQLAPVLQIKPSRTGTVVSWAGPATGYLLQQNPDISSANWSLVNSRPTMINGQNQVVFPTMPGVGAYRLVRTDALPNLSAPVAGAGPLKRALIAPAGF